MNLNLFQVDAFASSPFTGNPAGVCLLEKPAPNKFLQSLALEMNLSETAYLIPEKDQYRLRWFTPTTEIKLCGHATLASAHILWERGIVSSEKTIEFQTLSGLLTASLRDSWITLDFPANPPTPVPAPSLQLLSALGIELREVIETSSSSLGLMIEVSDAKKVETLTPDLSAFTKSSKVDVIVTAKGSGKFDFVSRFFAPYLGIPEDPVTGAAHCCLGPYWSKKMGKNEFLAYQASARGGEVRVTVGENGRVLLGGKAVTIFSGMLNIPS